MATPRDPLLERLQRAVAPDYRVERELGSGGMGRVYLAHQVALNRPVAIKVLRPELVTAEGAAAFQREALTVSRIQHPNLVVIYDAPTRPRNGLNYYIMEFIGGPTLAQRLESGPLPPAEVIDIGIDLLDGLATVHRLGFVHRDIKPSNIFLVQNRALLADFGIARPPLPEGDEHSSEGTVDYMALEQVHGKAITPRADLYSLGVVLYEAVAGKQFHAQGERVDWSAVPSALRAALQRATAALPEDRWPDAQAFRVALEGAREPARKPKVPPVVVIAAGGVALVALIVGIKVWPRGACGATTPGAPGVILGPIDYVGPDKYADAPHALECLVKRDLKGHVNFPASDPAAVSVRATLTVAGNDARLQLSGGLPTHEFHAPIDQVHTLGDSVSYQVVLAIWSERSPLAPSLPLRALPKTTDGLLRFLDAERRVDAAQWDAAYHAYLGLERSDTSCWICSWRITEIARWLSLEPDSDRERRVRLHADSLPPLYRSIIRAPGLPLPARLDTLRAAAENARATFLGWFQLGDELFHRGPLAGHGREEALQAFERAARLRPDFGPTWEHLAWAATAEGHAAEAAEALDSLAHRGTAADTFAIRLRMLLQLGFAWRFLPESSAIKISQQITSTPAIRNAADLGAGPRLLPTFDAPRGAIAVGELLQASTGDVQRSGLVAQTLGAVALGRLDDARDFGRKLNAVESAPEFGFFTAQLFATVALLDPQAVSVTTALEDLRPWTTGDADNTLHDRARWMSELLGKPVALRRAAPHQLALLVLADSLAAAGQPRAALDSLNRIDVDATAQQVDPFFRTIAHFRRAAWRARLGDIDGARRELVWHEHTDVIRLPTGAPQAAEVDWAFGTLARWRRARLLDGTASLQRDEACEAYAAVARHWAQAPAPYGMRADSARTRLRELKCRGTSP